jgi:hypothetical protein
MFLLGRHFEGDIMRLFHHVLTSCFGFSGQSCVTVGSPLSPVIAIIFVEDFEKAVLEPGTLLTLLLVPLHG